MSARDELRGTLTNTVCHVSNYPKRAQPYLLGSDMSVLLDKIADTLIEAGYAKPEDAPTQSGVPVSVEWGTDHWGEIYSEPDEGHARGVVGLNKKGTKLFRRVNGGPWEWVTS